MTFELSKPITDVVAMGQGALTTDAAVIAKLTDMAGDLAVNLGVAALIFCATIVASKWASNGARKALSRVRGFRHDPTVLSFSVQVVRVLVYAIGFIAVLQRLGVQTTSIIAVLGAASLAVGLALQGTLSNVAAGMMLLILRPYRVGDVININGNIGQVRRLDLFMTQLSDGANTKIMVPNAKVFGDTILNLSGQQTRRIELKIGVGYGDDLSQARDVLTATARAHPNVLPDPVPWAGVNELLDSSVQMILQAWVKSEDYTQTRSDLLQGAKEALDRAGIEIPYPHQVGVPYETDEPDCQAAPVGPRGPRGSGSTESSDAPGADKG